MKGRPEFGGTCPTILSFGNVNNDLNLRLPCIHYWQHADIVKITLQLSPATPALDLVVSPGCVLPLLATQKPQWPLGNHFREKSSRTGRSRQLSIALSYHIPSDGLEGRAPRWAESFRRICLHRPQTSWQRQTTKKECWTIIVVDLDEISILAEYASNELDFLQGYRVNRLLGLHIIALHWWWTSNHVLSSPSKSEFDWTAVASQGELS